MNNDDKRWLKVVDEETRIRIDRITGYKIEKCFVDDMTKELQYSEMGWVGTKNMFTVGIRPKKEVYKVMGEYLNEWYVLYVGATKQHAIDWLTELTE
jgi:hypothetical protein